MTHKKKSRLLFPEEEVLWDAFKQTVKPLPASKKKFQPIQETESTETLSFRPFQRESLPKKNRISPGERIEHHIHTQAFLGAASDPFEIDRKTLRRLAKGRYLIDATLDLHGYTVEQAYTKLKAFLCQSVACRNRFVRIITGKGTKQQMTIEKDTEENESWGRERSGKLRFLVPQWLHSPPLNALVVGIKSAHASHGGEGAFYIALKRKMEG